MNNLLRILSNRVPACGLVNARNISVTAITKLKQSNYYLPVKMDFNLTIYVLIIFSRNQPGEGSNYNKRKICFITKRRFCF